MYLFVEVKLPIQDLLVAIDEHSHDPIAYSQFIAQWRFGLIVEIVLSSHQRCYRKYCKH
jgi:hypothetical protein